MEDKNTTIESSTAARLSPVVLVCRPNIEKRLWLDYSEVSKQLATDIRVQFLHELGELVEKVSGNSLRRSQKALGRVD